MKPPTTRIVGNGRAFTWSVPASGDSMKVERQESDQGGAQDDFEYLLRLRDRQCMTNVPAKAVARCTGTS